MQTHTHICTYTHKHINKNTHTTDMYTVASYPGSFLWNEPGTRLALVWFPDPRGEGRVW